MNLNLRLVQGHEAATIVALSHEVQEWLQSRNSMQEIAVSVQEANESISKQIAYLIESPLDSGNPVGMVWLDPNPNIQTIETMHLHELAQPVVFLSKLMIRPKWMGLGLGTQVLQSVIWSVIPTKGMVALDCWVGNGKLRRLYENCGWRLVGEYPEDTWMVAVYAIASKNFIFTRNAGFVVGARDG